MSLLLAEGEQVVRKYRCAVVDYKSSDNSLDATGLVKKRPDTDGLVVVTNKRVLYYAEAAAPSKGSNTPAMHLQEAFIDRITSTEFIQADAKKSVVLPLALIIIGLLVTIYAILDDMEYMYLVPGVIVLVLGVLFLVLAMRGVDQLMMMKINTVPAHDDEDQHRCVRGRHPRVRYESQGGAGAVLLHDAHPRVQGDGVRDRSAHYRPPDQRGRLHRQVDFRVRGSNG